MRLRQERQRKVMEKGIQNKLKGMKSGCGLLFNTLAISPVPPVLPIVSIEIFITAARRSYLALDVSLLADVSSWKVHA